MDEQQIPYMESLIKSIGNDISEEISSTFIDQTAENSVVCIHASSNYMDIIHCIVLY